MFGDSDSIAKFTNYRHDAAAEAIAFEEQEAQREYAMDKDSAKADHDDGGVDSDDDDAWRAAMFSDPGADVGTADGTTRAASLGYADFCARDEEVLAPGCVCSIFDFFIFLQAVACLGNT